MNRKMIVYILGYVLILEAILMLLPAFVAIIYAEKAGFSFLIVSAISALLGFLITRKKPKVTIFYLKEGCVATALSWIVLSIFGALPFVISGSIPSFTDALFETISGFTTTGASILNEVESLPYSILFWRSFTHWIGGMGVLVFLLAIVPMNGGSHMNLMRAESPGPSVGKLVPKVKHTARILYLIYMGITIVEIILLLFGGMGIFDAVTTSFGTAGTGGFGIKNDSIGGYNAYIQWIVTIFMILFGVNFNAYYYMLYRKWKKAFGMEEVKWYLIVIAAAVGGLMFTAYDGTITFFHNLRDMSFQVASVITTTGFSTVDFDKWPEISRFIMIAVMFVGACAGSTGGGIKVSRFIIAVKNIGKELGGYLHPKGVKKTYLEGKPVEHEVSRAVNVYFEAFFLIFALSMMLISFEGYDGVTNFTAIVATMNNIGPGLNMVGPTQNFGFFSNFSKYVLMFDMLAGRLELFPMLLLFHPSIWKLAVAKKKGH